MHQQQHAYRTFKHQQEKYHYISAIKSNFTLVRCLNQAASANHQKMHHDMTGLSWKSLEPIFQSVLLLEHTPVQIYGYLFLEQVRDWYIALHHIWVKIINFLPRPCIHILVAFPGCPPGELAGIIVLIVKMNFVLRRLLLHQNFQILSYPWAT